MQWKIPILTGLVIVFSPLTAAADHILVQFADWGVQKKDPGVCFTRGAPAVLSSSVQDRKESYVQVSHFPMMNLFDQVFVIPGYNYQPGSTVVVFVDDGPQFQLAEDGYKAASDPSNQADLTVAMREGDELVVIGVSENGEETTDIYALEGFAEAYAEISRLCVPQ